MDIKKNEETQKSIEITKDTNTTKKQDMENINYEKKIFSTKITRLNALASNNIKQKDFDIDKATNDSENYLKALCTAGGLQEMLASQMLSIHNLQQSSMAMAIASVDIINKQYFTNAAIKLANSFTQQAALLAKLQGIAGQKIVVEHVEVHQGGQAIVGNVNKGGGKMKKNENEPTLSNVGLTPYCLAKIRKGNGALCCSLVIPGKKRCRIHGGAYGSGGQPGNKNAHSNIAIQREKPNALEKL